MTFTESFRLLADCECALKEISEPKLSVLRKQENRR